MGQFSGKNAPSRTEHKSSDSQNSLTQPYLSGFFPPDSLEWEFLCPQTPRGQGVLTSMLLSKTLCRDAGCCSGFAGSCAALPLRGVLCGKEGEVGLQAPVTIGVVCQEGPAERRKAKNSNSGSPFSAHTRSSPPPEAMQMHSRFSPPQPFTQENPHP